MAAKAEYIRASGGLIESHLENVGFYEQDLERAGRLTPPMQEALQKARDIRIGHNVLFYLAGALTGVEEPVKQRYSAVSELIATKPQMFGYAPHLHGTDPIKHPDVTPEEVRDIDYLFAAIVPDAHINFWHPTAHGNAIEEGWAEAQGKPSLYVVPEGAALSRLVRGMRNIVDTIVYSDFEEEALPQIDTFLDRL
ncbi:MAG: hypothetical protein WDN27_06395 [Candidatus Saccharibacteria bacterium]